LGLRTYLAVAFAIVSMGKAHAVFLDGDTLRGWCTSEDAGDQAACLGYVVGVADVLISADGGEPAQSEACIPAVETTQVVDVAKRYLESHRQAGDTAASDQVARALSEAFPCP
jgi:Rap1a immunity proteins